MTRAALSSSRPGRRGGEHGGEHGGERGGERGAVLPIVALCLVFLIGAVALSVDIGRLAERKRELQACADLTAMDAMSKLDGTSANAVYSAVNTVVASSAANNTVKTANGDTATFLLGQWDTAHASFTPLANQHDTVAVPTAVSVTCTAPVGFMFGTGSRTTSGTSTARRSTTTPALGGVAVGSYLASIDTNESTLLNGLLGGMLGSSLNVTLAGYQGLANSTVTLEQLRVKLGAGSVSQMLTANTYTPFQIFDATLKILDPSGTSTADFATALGRLKASATNTTQISLGQFVKVASGYENAAASSSVDVFSLVRGTAMLENGSHTVSLSNVGVTVPGISSMDLSASVISPPSIAIGPPGSTVAKTSQVNFNLTARISLSVLSIASVPVTVAAAQASASFDQAICGVPHQSLVGASTQAANVTVGASILAGILVGGSTTVPGAAPRTLTFNGPFNWSNTQTVGTPSVGIGSAVSAKASLLGAVSAVVTGLANIDGLFGPLDRALGVSIAGADVTDFMLNCSVPSLG